MKKIIPLVLVGGLFALSGCQQIAEEAAKRPYRKAMEQGRMSPSEYQTKIAEIEQAARSR